MLLKVAFSLDLHCLDDHNCKVHRNLSKCLEGYSESYYQPLLSLSLYKQSYQKTISTSISVLRQCAKECIEQRLLAMEDSKKRPNDILQMILEAFDVNSKNSHAIMEELVDEFLTFFLAGNDFVLKFVSLCGNCARLSWGRKRFQTPDQANSQGPKITEESVLPLL